MSIQWKSVGWNVVLDPNDILYKGKNIWIIYQSMCLGLGKYDGE